MPEGNLVLQANYYAAAAATPGNASIDYTPKTGAVALDLSDDRMEDLIDELTNNSSDQDAMTAGLMYFTQSSSPSARPRHRSPKR